MIAAIKELVEVLKTSPAQKADLPSVYSPLSTLQLETERKPDKKVPEGVYTKNKITTNGKEFTRETHALLFRVVDWLGVNPQARELSSRKLAVEFEMATKTSVSHVWAGIAKNYWIVNGS